MAKKWSLQGGCWWPPMMESGTPRSALWSHRKATCWCNTWALWRRSAWIRMKKLEISYHLNLEVEVKQKFERERERERERVCEHIMFFLKSFADLLTLLVLVVVPVLVICSVELWSNFNCFFKLKIDLNSRVSKVLAFTSCSSTAVY